MAGSFDLPEFGDSKSGLIAIAPVEALQSAKAIDRFGEPAIVLYAHSCGGGERKLAINLRPVLRSPCAAVGIAYRAEEEVAAGAGAQPDLVGFNAEPRRADVALVSPGGQNDVSAAERTEAVSIGEFCIECAPIVRAGIRTASRHIGGDFSKLEIRRRGEQGAVGPEISLAHGVRLFGGRHFSRLAM